ncbi:MULTISPECIES: hypothetical protein [unclassified Spirosoma]|uniref:hypothetical protein n=1 Tax=unclassified Spirosoma TaxID=2621999 RepID=UPI000969CDE4|nr:MULTISPECIES: hypothetical protein [unclassified Spirosoma]MBN8825952.1 hypothetical protein [Spirosoma sp.]OJW70984.1 MAG: hypothetical protein BGO59_32735 [Spirosoma sp. 48-14]
MKQFVFVLLGAMLLGGCHNETVSPAYAGNWIWSQSAGGFAGIVYKPKAGEQVLLRLDEAGKLTITRSDTIFFSSDYSVQKTAKADEYVLAISNKKVYSGAVKNFVPVLYGNQQMIFQTGKLTLYDIDITDGFSHIFIR